MRVSRSSALLSLVLTTLTLPSFAKINLSLRVLGRRADGYHEVRTVLQTITLHDTLSFEARDDWDAARLEIFCDDPAIPTDERNLVAKAARAIQRFYGTSRGTRVGIKKRIPAGGGLGGGSSNAAVALLALSRLWRLPVSETELTRLAGELGADVPFFLTGGTALGTGIGATITPLPNAEHNHLIVITPCVEVPTIVAFKALNASPMDSLTKTNTTPILSVSHTTAIIEQFKLDEWRNDFEPTVFRLYPQTEAARMRLTDCGAHRVLLSGSGASLFGIFDKADQARAFDELSKSRSSTNWRVFNCATLDREAYREALRSVLMVSDTKI